MKTSMNCKLFFFAACLCIAVACGNKKKKMLVGTWKLVDQSITCNNPAVDSAEAIERRNKNLPNMSMEQESADALRAGNSYTFKKDGKYTAQGSYNSQGEYTLADSGIIMSMDLGLVTDVYTFNSLTDSILDITKGIRMRGHTHTYREKYRKVNDR